MTFLLLTVYNVLVVPLFLAGVRIAGLFNAKIRTGLRGRRRLFSVLQEQLAPFSRHEPRLWIHSSSAGEFEQGRPVIREFRKRHPNGLVVLSFFSPSGYENVHFDEENSIKTYLPADTLRNVRRFIELVRPTLACVVRHDIWPNYQFHLKRKGIPSILLNASISDEKLFIYRALRPLVRLLYSTFSDVCAVSQENLDRLYPFYPRPHHLHVTGDTRYDQVMARAQESEKIRFLQEGSFFEPSQTLVAGSTWPGDEKHLLPALERVLRNFPRFKVVIVPHEVTPNHLDDIESFFSDRGIALQRFSRLGPRKAWDFSVLLVDAFGLLANLYALGRLAYVGGGFGLGVNSVLEPAAHGCAVLFGPRHLNVVEAKQLRQCGGARMVRNEHDILSEISHCLEDPGEAERRGKAAKKFVLEHVGASGRTLDLLDKYLTRAKEFARAAELKS